MYNIIVHMFTFVTPEDKKTVHLSTCSSPLHITSTEEHY